RQRVSRHTLHVVVYSRMEQADTLLEVWLALGSGEQIEELRVLEAPRLLVVLEENAHPVVRIAPVTVPADHVEVPRVAAVDRAQEVRPERQHVRSDAETRILEACLEGLEGALRVRQVGPRSREVVEVELDRKRKSCLLQ